MGRVSTAKPKQDRSQIRIWLATVLNPMLRALDVELGFAKRGNWSFRCDSQDFEYLWPTEMMVAVPHRPNAEQVFRYHPAVGRRAAAHDESLAALRKSCQEVYRKVMHSSVFLKLPKPAGDLANGTGYLAEYVVNGLRDLPSHYVHADFWRTHGADYLALRSERPLAPCFRSLRMLGTSFKGDVQALSQRAKALRDGLADKASLAPVDPELS